MISVRRQVGSASFTDAYTYDRFGRLGAHAQSKGAASIYSLDMQYNHAGGITFKNGNGSSFMNATALTYDLQYHYDPSKDHQLDHIWDPASGTTTDFTYNTSGSITQIDDPSQAIAQNFFWNEQQQLTGVSNQQGVHHYVYDHSGERIMKSSLINSKVYLNDQVIDDVSNLEPYTVYVNPFYVVTGLMGGDRVSKHYYMNQQRVATDITINYDPNGTGGGPKEQALAKDPASAAPELSPALANFSEVLVGLGQKPLDTASLKLPTIASYYPEAAKTPATSSSAEGNPSAPRILFWYHPDYLGNVDLITERDGYTHEFFMYNPWGEEMHQWNANTYAFTSPYRFNAKELDPETGLAYYGARYYQNKIGVWLSVDPLAMHSFQIDKSPYVAFWNNPIVFNDPDGRCPDCPDPSTAKEGDIVNPNGGMDFIFKDGEWTGIGGTLDEVTVTAPSSEGIRGLGSGFVDGFGAGIGNTVDFFASLGTTQGWKDLGQGMLDMSMLGCQTCPQGMMMRTQMADRTINYVQNIPNMSAYEMGFDLGFSTEKALEIGITRNVMPIPKTALGIRNVGKASRFSTIQSVNTYGKWGTFSQRQFTWPTGGYTLDKATFYNRNFIIPSGRVVGVGQFQHFQKK